MPAQKNTFVKLVKNPFKFRVFLLRKLPAGFFTGLKIEEFDESRCVVSVPYKWFNKNPFRSTYFASLAMAAELSTGALAMANVYGLNPGVSMLVVKIEAGFLKKATGKTYFTCNDGEEFRKAIDIAVHSGEPQTLQAHSTGVNEAGEEVARFAITWSFKVKSVN